MITTCQVAVVDDKMPIRIENVKTIKKEDHMTKKKVRIAKLTPVELNLRVAIAIKRYPGQKARQLKLFDEMIESRKFKNRVKKGLRALGLMNKLIIIAVLAMMIIPSGCGAEPPEPIRKCMVVKSEQGMYSYIDALGKLNGLAYKTREEARLIFTRFEPDCQTWKPSKIFTTSSEGDSPGYKIYRNKEGKYTFRYPSGVLSSFMYDSKKEVVDSLMDHTDYQGHEWKEAHPGKHNLYTFYPTAEGATIQTERGVYVLDNGLIIPKEPEK